MLRLFFMQGWSKSTDVQRVQLAILSTIFSDGKVFQSKPEGAKSYFIFSRTEKSLLEISKAIDAGMQSIGLTNPQYVLMEPKEMRGSVTSDFGKEEMNSITELYIKFRDQETPESIVNSMRDEIKDEK